MDEKAVEKFEPQKLAWKLRERMRDSIADLMSDADWSTLVDAELKKFFEPQLDRFREKRPSVFAEILREEFEADVRARIKKHLATDPGWAAQWPPEGTYLPQKLDAMIAENLPAIMKGIIAGAVEGLGGGVASAIQFAIESKNREYSG